MYGQIIRELRELRRMNQEDLAIAINSTQQKISNYENEKVEPDIATLLKLANFFNVTIDFLLGRKPPNQTIDERLERINNLSKKSQETIEKIIGALEAEERTKNETTATGKY